MDTQLRPTNYPKIVFSWEIACNIITLFVITWTCRHANTTTKTLAALTWITFKCTWLFNVAFATTRDHAIQDSFFTPLHMFFISSLIWTIEDFVAYIYAFASLPSLPALPASCQYCSVESHASQCTTNLTSGMFTPKPKATVQIMSLMVDSFLTKFWIIVSDLYYKDQHEMFQ